MDNVSHFIKEQEKARIDAENKVLALDQKLEVALAENAKLRSQLSDASETIFELQKRNLPSENPYPFIAIGEVPGITIFARRTEVNGLEFASGDIGGGQIVVDLSTVSTRVLKWIVDNWVEVDNLLPDTDEVEKAKQLKERRACHFI